MKTKFIIKAKKLNKKWLDAVKALYGKQKLVITINTEDEELMDFVAFDDDDDWWEEDNFEGEEEKEEEEELVVVADKSKESNEVSVTAEKVSKKKQKETEKEEKVVAEAEVKKPRGPYKKTKEKLANAESSDTTENAEEKPSNKGGRTKKTPLIEDSNA